MSRNSANFEVIMVANSPVTISKGQINTDGCARITFSAPCDECGEGIVDQDAVVSVTGQKLSSGHTPAIGEIIKNHFRECRKCRDWQAS